MCGGWNFTYPQTPEDSFNNTSLNLIKAHRGGPIFSNLKQLVDILHREIVVESDQRHSAENINHIKSILSLMNFNQKEWRQYSRFVESKYTRNLIGYDEKFTIILLCWERGQGRLVSHL